MESFNLLHSASPLSALEAAALEAAAVDGRGRRTMNADVWLLTLPSTPRFPSPTSTHLSSYAEPCVMNPCRATGTAVEGRIGETCDVPTTMSAHPGSAASVSSETQS